MKSDHWPLVAVGALVAVVVLAYLFDPVVPIFLITVLGLPVTAFLLNRSPR